jgi:hypothetical protein
VNYIVRIWDTDRQGKCLGVKDEEGFSSFDDAWKRENELLSRGFQCDVIKR